MTSYRKYSELGSTPSEKMQQQIAQQKAMEAQAIIKKQQDLLEEQRKKLEDQRRQIARSSRIAQQAANSRAQLAYNQNKNKYKNRRNNPTPTPTGAVHVKTKKQKHKAIWGNEICVFKISAPWCGPCKTIAPLYDNIAKSVNNPGKVMLFSEELDDKLSADVEGVPAFDYYFRGKKQHRQMGADIDQVRKNIQMMTSQAQSISSGVQAKLEPATPHPADGMQSKKSGLSNQGMYPPSAMRM
jgi:thiol-disulfide isomerase/thioredoxin